MKKRIVVKNLLTALVIILTLGGISLIILTLIGLTNPPILLSLIFLILLIVKIIREVNILESIIALEELFTGKNKK
tara:strand:- start:81 stop:308 length:228 start_codon:yes stop_codon:yes gene_type:complete